MSIATCHSGVGHLVLVVDLPKGNKRRVDDISN
jgi:hypothetical protein